MRPRQFPTLLVKKAAKGDRSQCSGDAMGLRALISAQDFVGQMGSQLSRLFSACNAASGVGEL